MYNKTKKRPTKSKIKVNEAYEGVTIELKVNAIVNNKEPIKDNSPVMYLERSEGVPPGTDIRTDRWDVALDAMNAVSKDTRAKRANKAKVIEMDKDQGKSETSQ